MTYVYCNDGHVIQLDELRFRSSREAIRVWYTLLNNYYTVSSTRYKSDEFEGHSRVSCLLAFDPFRHCHAIR